jgi:hypothetical protein
MKMIINRRTGTWVSMVIAVWFIITLIPYDVSAGTGDLSVTHSFSKNPAMQTEQVTITVNIRNDRTQPVRLQRIGVHFDWIQSGYYYYDPSVNESNVMYVAIGDTYKSTISFDVPILAAVGTNGWNVQIKYQEGGIYWSDESYQGETENDFVVSAYAISAIDPSTPSASTVSLPIFEIISAVALFGVVAGIALTIRRRKTRTMRAVPLKARPPV